MRRCARALSRARSGRWLSCICVHRPSMPCTYDLCGSCTEPDSDEVRRHFNKYQRCCLSVCVLVISLMHTPSPVPVPPSTLPSTHSFTAALYLPCAVVRWCYAYLLQSPHRPNHYSPTATPTGITAFESTASSILKFRKRCQRKNGKALPTHQHAKLPRKTHRENGCAWVCAKSPSALSHRGGVYMRVGPLCTFTNQSTPKSLASGSGTTVKSVPLNDFAANPTVTRNGSSTCWGCVRCTTVPQIAVLLSAR